MKFGSPYCMEMTSTVRRSFDRKLCAIALSIMLISSHVRPANSSVVYQRVLQTNGDSSSGGLIPSSAVRSTMSSRSLSHFCSGVASSFSSYATSVHPLQLLCIDALCGQRLCCSTSLWDGLSA
eukprot:GHVS01108878.1.p2 GENE.GHVS01108878.1~~GHVS01108878.1.p2  ORF type:complete len:123 (+),score=5.39 GHVS01108878.1:724-1092(+)